MGTKLLLRDAEILAIVMSLATLVVMARRSKFATFRSLGFYILSLFLLESIQVPILFFRKTIGIEFHLAYSIFWYSTHILAVVQAVMMVAVIYGVFNQAMRPLKGLQRMGKLVFKWVAAVSVILGLVFALGPHLLYSGNQTDVAWTTLVERAQEGVNVLTLCLLLFVCVSIKPLGLTFRSHVFGVTLGLGIISTTALVQAAWFWTSGAHSVYSPIYLFGTIGYLVAITTWGGYLMVPESERMMILLPTTSPFFAWNRIAEALGDAPGKVAIGFKPSMISNTEVEVMTAMSKAKAAKDRARLSEAESELDTVAVS